MKHYAIVSALLFGLLHGMATAAPPALERVSAAQAGMNAGRLAHIDDIVEDALRLGRMPGCVVMVGHAGKIVLLKAYGHRQLEPSQQPMTTDTVFDLASLTKPIATATSVMKLVEEGKLKLEDRVAQHVPDFGANGKESITIKQLLTHQGGLIPDNKLSDYNDGHDEAMRRINALKPYVEPGTRFVYTDVGFIVLAELVRTLTGKNIADYSRETFFEPLGMAETMYRPHAALRDRCAPTEKRGKQWMRGEVHDPRAFRLGGIAGHAGLFSTCEDLARFAQMLINGGEYEGVRVLEEETVRLMTTAVPVPSGLRGLGWDMRTGYSSNRGDFLSSSAFGHGGFTGTTFWVDPTQNLFVVLLSNRVHPNGKGSVNRLAGRIGTIAAVSLLEGLSRDPSTGGATGGATDRVTLTGIDVLQRDGFRRLQGRRVGLITNQTGRDRSGRSTVEVLHRADNVELVALFSPEHGFAGRLDVAKIADSTDEDTGLKIYSLYGKTRTPSAESLQGIDTLVFDIQDIGTRFYTYISTMGNAMRAAGEHGIRFVVLDRPNPIGGLHVQGPVLDTGSESFVGFHPIAVRHGMTAGELARMFHAELQLNVDLEIVRLEGWERGDLFDATGLLWTNPSPNMRSLTQALLYPGVGLLETTNLSVGRGTDTPFEVVGAPWIDGVKLAAHLNATGLSGTRFVPIEFVPDASKFKDKTCGGINIVITDRTVFDPIRVGLSLAHALRQLFPDDWDTRALNRLLGNVATRDAILSGGRVSDVQRVYRDGLNDFMQRRTRFLLYE